MVGQTKMEDGQTWTGDYIRHERGQNRVHAADSMLRVKCRV